MSERIDRGTPIRTVEELEGFGTPITMVRDKVLDRLDDVHVAWLAATPLVFLATASADGRCDLSPKGDPPGFVKVLDPRTIVLPDRPGNRRMDGHHNLLSNPHAGLLCVIPGRADTLRINGRATPVRDAGFMESMCVAGHRPSLALVVDVEEVYFHCPKAFRRAAAWDVSTWTPQAAPSQADIALALWRKGEDRNEVEERCRRDSDRPLYTDE